MENSEYLLRIGIIPDCNFKCVYCNPTGNRSNSKILKNQEITDIIQIANELGINRIHLTGGEPLLKKNLIKILENVKQKNKIKYYITTNGSLLKKYAKDLKRIGVERLNVSIDSINNKSYKNVTKSNQLNQVLEGLKEAKKYFKVIKLNAIVMREYNLNNLDELIDYAQENNFILRLSELLPFSSDRLPLDFFQKNHVSKKEIEEFLSKKGKLKKIKISGNNWACDYYKVGKLKTPIAIVYHHTRGYSCVCDKCKSIRISPRGDLAACYTFGYPTQNIRGLDFKSKKNEFKRCFKIKKNLKKEGYPLYHIPDYTLFRANVGEKWRK